VNLLAETKEMIEGCNHTPYDIVFIGSTLSGHQCTWDEFVVLADREYDAGYGCAEVASDLEIHFSNGDMICRYIYDGSEYWRLIEVFKQPAHRKPIHSLFGEYDNLADINK
jgi:hypothetical protein